jgi:hypothetical protein
VLHGWLAWPKEEGNAENTEKPQKKQKKKTTLNFSVFSWLFSVLSVFLFFELLNLTLQAKL